MCKFETSLNIRRFFSDILAWDAGYRPFFKSLLRQKAGITQKAVLCLFGLAALTFWMGAYNAAFAQTIPCHVRLVFDTHPNGGQIVRYQLYMQVKNQTPQPLLAVSTHWLDKTGEIIGKREENCRGDGNPTGLSQTGKGSAQIQTVNQRWMEKLGQMIWTEMVNSELSEFKRIKSCKIVGYRFE